MLCNHANEVPLKACACPSWCACRKTMCAPRAPAPAPPRASFREAAEQVDTTLMGPPDPMTVAECDALCDEMTPAVVPIEAVPWEIRNPEPTHEELQREAASDPKFLIESLPDLSFFEMREILRFRARRYHKATTPPAGLSGLFCPCGEPHGGPQGATAPCRALGKLFHYLGKVEAEISHHEWAASQPGYAQERTQEPEDD